MIVLTRQIKFRYEIQTCGCLLSQSLIEDGVSGAKA